MNNLVTLQNSYYIKMGWKYISFVDNYKKYIFYIEPMYKGNDKVYLPSNKSECENAINAIQSVKWNRNLEYIEADFEMKIVSIESDEIEEGTLESTKAGKEYLNLDMFDPGFSVEREKVHELWCILEKRFAEVVEGKVTIKSNGIVKDSVFDKVTVPALMNNGKVTLFIEGK